jgi:hypothetical protein
MPGHVPPQGARREAEIGLEWRKEFRRGGTKVGIARARDLMNGRQLSDSTIRRMVSYFARHEVDKRGRGWNRGEPGFPSAGRIAWALWGGDAGRAWATRIHKSIMRGNPPPEDDESLEDFLDRASGELHPEMRPGHSADNEPMPPIQSIRSLLSGGVTIEDYCMLPDEVILRMRRLGRPAIRSRLSTDGDSVVVAFGDWDLFVNRSGGTPTYMLSTISRNEPYRFSNADELLDFARENFPEPVEDAPPATAALPADIVLRQRKQKKQQSLSVYRQIIAETLEQMNNRHREVGYMVPPGMNMGALLSEQRSTKWARLEFDIHPYQIARATPEQVVADCEVFLSLANELKQGVELRHPAPFWLTEWSTYMQGIATRLMELASMELMGADPSDDLVKEQIKNTKDAIESLKDLMFELFRAQAAAWIDRTGQEQTGEQTRWSLIGEEIAGPKHAWIAKSPFERSVSYSRSFPPGTRVQFVRPVLRFPGETVMTRATGTVVMNYIDESSPGALREAYFSILLDPEFCSSDHPEDAFVVYLPHRHDSATMLENLYGDIENPSGADIRASLLEMNPAEMISNPPWVTAVLAKDYEWLEDNIPRNLLPRLRVAKVKGKTLRSMSAQMPEYGCGIYGCVVATLDPRYVLKVTTDPSEAEFAMELAEDLSANVTCNYPSAIATQHDRKKGQPIFYLWRDSAEFVGKIDEYLESVGRDPEPALRAIGEQWDAAQVALVKLWDKEDAVADIENWARKVQDMGRADPSLKYLSDGMLKILKNDRIFFGDVHPGNLGLIRGKILIVDPGNIVKLTGNTPIRMP